MDQPGLDRVQHDAALRGLTRIHQWSGLVGRFWKPIRSFLKQRLEQQQTLQRESTFRIMDVGCGDGYLTRRLAARARRDGWAVEFALCDFSETAIELASQRCMEESVAATCHVVDVLKDDLPGSADVVVCSLFLHHFSESEVVTILRRMNAAGGLVIIEDLRRTRLGYWLAVIVVRLLSRSPVVHFDGPVSVTNAFTIDEMRSLCQQAGLANFSFVRRWPQRFVLTWSRV